MQKVERNKKFFKGYLIKIVEKGVEEWRETNGKEEKL